MAIMVLVIIIIVVVVQIKQRPCQCSCIPLYIYIYIYIDNFFLWCNKVNLHEQGCCHDVFVELVNIVNLRTFPIPLNTFILLHSHFAPLIKSS